MEARAYIKNTKVSPKKLRFLLPEVKKLTPQKALDKLFYVENKPARILYKAIQSAIQNAKATFNATEDMLIFKTLAIEEGLKQKRKKAGGRGTVKPFVRRYSHIKVVLVAQKTLPTVKKLTQSKKERKKAETKLKVKTQEK